MSSLGKRVRVSARHPEAAAICDRCGQSANHVDLVRQMAYRGSAVTYTGLLVHRRGCLDPLDPLDKPLRIPPDGFPIRDPRPDRLPGSTVLGTERGAVLADENLIPLVVDVVTS